MYATGLRLFIRLAPPGLALAGLFACKASVTAPGSDSSLLTISHEPMPPLEEVPYEAIGNNRIAFHRLPDTPSAENGWGVYVVDGATHTSTSYLGGSDIIDPRVSPDGSSVAFETYTGIESAWDVYVVPLVGAGIHQVSNTEGNTESPPNWTPGGEVVFAEDRDGACCVEQLRRGRPSEGIAAPVYQFPLPHYGFSSPYADLAVGPSGSIAFNEGGARLSVLETADMSMTTLYEPATSDSVWTRVFAPMWSPDGTSIAFLEVVQQADGEDTWVKRLDLATGAVADLTVLSGKAVPWGLFANEIEYSACWTRDGTTIVFTSPVGGTHYSVFAVPASGGDAVRITSAPAVSDVSVSCF